MNACGKYGNPFTFQETSSSSVNISFPYIFDDSLGKVVNFSLEVKKNDQLYRSHELEVNHRCNMMHHHLNDLPNAEYQVQLKASNRLNNVSTSSVGRFTICEFSFNNLSLVFFSFIS